MIDPMPGVSVFIQTLNEESNLEECLKCFSWCDDIVILDSFSDDGTEEIAKKYGARWVQREYKGRAAHQNWAMENIEFKHSWVYYSDADERVPEALAREIAYTVANGDPDVVAYRVNRRDYFQNKWIPRSTNYPLRIIRLFKPDKIRWERKANPIPRVSGKVGELKNDYLHYPFSKGISDWVSRHNRYSSYEAEETIRSLQSNDFSPRELLDRDPVIRRKALKTLSFRIPARPMIKFIYMFILKRGFLDGGAGFRYCMLQSFYEFLIVLKAREIFENSLERE